MSLHVTGPISSTFSSTLSSTLSSAKPNFVKYKVKHKVEHKAKNVQSLTESWQLTCIYNAAVHPKRMDRPGLFSR